MFRALLATDRLRIRRAALVVRDQLLFCREVFTACLPVVQLTQQCARG